MNETDARAVAVPGGSIGQAAWNPASYSAGRFLQRSQNLRVVPVPLTVHAVRGLDGLESVAPDWLRLEAATRNTTFCNRVAWFRAYLTSLAPDPERIVFVIVRRGRALVAVFPLRMASRASAIPGRRVLESVTHDHVNLADCLIDPNVEPTALLDEVMHWLRNQREVAWDVIKLNRIPAGSALIEGLCHDRRGWRPAGAEQYTTFIDCDAPFEQALQAVSGAFKRNLRRLRRRAEETGGLDYQTFREPGELDRALTRFLEVEAAGWKGGEGTCSAIKLHPETELFYRRLVANFGSEGRCVINLLRHGERDAAGQFCLLTDGVLHILKIGYVDSCASFAPGNLLMEHTLRTSCEDPAVTGVSFVTNPPWSHLWKPRLVPLAQWQLFNTTPLGLMSFRLKQLQRGSPAASEPAHAE